MSGFFEHHDRRIQPVSESGCWIWTGALFSTGYGEVQVAGRRMLAHRVAYSEAVGPIPEGMMVRHRCDVRCCVNPDHLVVGTQLDNMADMKSRNRQSRGEHRPNSKFSAEIVRQMRADFAAGATIYRIAKNHGASWGVAWRIIHNHSWRHV